MSNCISPVAVEDDCSIEDENAGYESDGSRSDGSDILALALGLVCPDGKRDSGQFENFAAISSDASCGEFKAR